MKFTALSLMLTLLVCATNGERQSRVRGLRSSTGSGGGSKKGKDSEDDSSDDVSILDGVVGAVFSSTNAAPADLDEPLGNELVMYHQLSDGTLRGPVGRYQTGGTGVNAASSQNSIITRGNQVFVANGSNNPINAAPEGRTAGSVSRFTFNEFGALLTDEVPTGGENPVSLALCDDILYVANAAFLNGQNMIVGFEPPSPFVNSTITALYVEADGSLTPLPDLTQDVGQGRIVDIVLSEDRTQLTAAASGLNEGVISFEVDPDTCMLTGSSAASPPGASLGPVALSLLELDGNNYVYSANILDGSVSSYKIADDGLELVNDSVGTGMSTAVCWTAIVGGKYLYTANAGVSSVSSFAINQDDGSISLLEIAAAAVTDANGVPIDMVVDGDILYVLFGGIGEIYAYRVAEDGTLTQEQTIGGLPGSQVPVFDLPLGLTVAKF